MGEPTTQVPMPSQVEAGVSAPSGHEAGLQTEPGVALVQPPAPLHSPFSPQLEGASFLQTPWGSITPAPTGPQSPFWMGRAQLTLAPVQAVFQQKPSAQKPESHSAAQSQVPPSPFFLDWSQPPSSAMV